MRDNTSGVPVHPIRGEMFWPEMTSTVSRRPIQLHDEHQLTDNYRLNIFWFDCFFYWTLLSPCPTSENVAIIRISPVVGRCVKRTAVYNKAQSFTLNQLSTIRPHLSLTPPHPSTHSDPHTNTHTHPHSDIHSDTRTHKRERERMTFCNLFPSLSQYVLDLS